MAELRLPASCFSTPAEEEAFFSEMPPVTMAYPEIYEYVIQIDEDLATEETLVLMLSLFRRYHVPLAQFAAFETPANRPWFRDPDAWWYAAVFGSDKRVDAGNNPIRPMH